MPSSFKTVLFVLFVFFLNLSTFVSSHPIEIETERMVMRPWHVKNDTPVWGEIERDDSSPPFARFFPWLVSDPDASEEIAMYDKEKAQSTYDRVLEEELSKHFAVPLLPAPYTFSIYIKKTQELIGFIEFSKLDKRGFSKFGWALAHASRGKGYGTEILNKVFNYFGQFVGMEVPDFSGESKNWRKFNGLRASVNILNPASLKTLGKYMLPYKFDDLNLFGGYFMDVCFQYPLTDVPLNPNDLQNISDLSSRKESVRCNAIQNIIKEHGKEGGFYPALSRLLFEMYIRPMLRNDFATRGLPAPL